MFVRLHGRALLGALMLAAAPAAAQDKIRFADAQLSTGVRLHYAEQGDRGGEPVILLHGYSDSWQSYSLVMPYLDGRYHVFALDLRGHGDSDRPASGYAMRDLAADVIAFMQAKGIPQATIVGHSMGTLVAQQMALAAPRRVTRLVLVGGGVKFESDAVREVATAVRALTDPVSEGFVREFQQGTIYRPVPAKFFEDAVAASSKLPARVWQALLDGILGVQPPVALRAARIPTLVLWGDHDVVVSRADQDALVDLLGSATLSVYAETGHALHWERPAAFAADLRDFIARTPRLARR